MKAATIRRPQPHNLRGISIHAAREGGDFRKLFAFITFAISIHAAREGGDQYGNVTSTAIVISIHAAREGGDRYGCKAV